MQDQSSRQMDIGSLCETVLIAVEATDTLFEAARRMAFKRVGALAVLDDGVLVGLITEADLVSAIAEETSLAKTFVRDYMTEGPITVATTDDVGLAARRMVEHGIGHLPVMSSGAAIGMVSKGDLLAIGAVPTPRKVATSDDRKASEPRP